MDHLGTVQALNLLDRLHRLESEDEMSRTRWAHVSWNVLPVKPGFMGFTSDVVTVVEGKFQVCDCVGLTPGTVEDGDHYAPLAVNLANARAISALPDLITACQLLIEQYRAVPEFTMGGKLTNEPFLLVMEALKKAGVE